MHKHCFTKTSAAGSLLKAHICLDIINKKNCSTTAVTHSSGSAKPDAIICTSSLDLTSLSLPADVALNPYNLYLCVTH